MINKDDWQSLVDHLRSHLPLSHPVDVRFHRFTEPVAGDCLFTGKRFRIRINPALSERQAWGTLLHEFAHTLSWSLDDGEDHTDWFREARVLVFQCFCWWLQHRTPGA